MAGVSNLPLANQVTRQFADFPDTDMKFASKAAFETAIANMPRIPDGWLAYCTAEKEWYKADKVNSSALPVGGSAFDQALNTTDSPTFGGLTINGPHPLIIEKTAGAAGSAVQSITHTPDGTVTPYSMDTVKNASGKAKTLVFRTVSPFAGAPSDIEVPVDVRDSGGNMAFLSDLEARLATDAETQITAQPAAEDDKFVSRLKLFNWWTWVRSQAQSLTGIWTFSNGAVFGGKTTAGTTAANNAHHTVAASTAITAHQRLIPGTAYTGTEDGAEWYESNGTTSTRRRQVTGAITNDVLFTYNNYLLQGGNGNYILERNKFGDISSVNEIIEQFVYDQDVIDAITGASYNAQNSFTAALTPANNAVMKAGQLYKNDSDVYLAVSDNTCCNLTGLAKANAVQIAQLNQDNIVLKAFKFSNYK